ncbi:MAG: lanthionine synthetase C family protein [Hyphomicrobiales bacterium]
MEWKRLIDESHSSYLPLKNKLEEIKDYFLKKSNEEILEEKGVSLLGGASGISLFLLQYGSAFNEEEVFDKGIDLISLVFNTLGSMDLLDTHAGGLSGIGWLLEYFEQKKFIECDTDEVLSDCDEILYSSMITNIKEHENFDFLHGGIGNILYFLNRKKSKVIASYIQEFIDELYKYAVKEEDGGIKFRSKIYPKENVEQWVYNLSLSHGMVSIMIAMAKIIRKYPEVKGPKELLYGIYKYVRRYDNFYKEELARFPSWINYNEEDPPSTGSRLGWCYGDLGIGMAMLISGDIIGDNELKAYGKDILEETTKRKTKLETNINDGCLCHGTAGIIHIYNRAFQYTSSDKLKKGAEYHANALPQDFSDDNFPLGYKLLRLDSVEFEDTFLEGIAGVGLVIIALITDQSPDWDASLLIS